MLAKHIQHDLFGAPSHLYAHALALRTRPIVAAATRLPYSVSLPIATLPRRP